jgi:hypothetical protein
LTTRHLELQACELGKSNLWAALFDGFALTADAMLNRAPFRFSFYVESLAASLVKFVVSIPGWAGQQLPAAAWAAAEQLPS